jgi:UDP-glucose 4-epimerase
MDLAQGHIVAIDALDRDEVFAQPTKAEGFGGSGGKFKAYNLGKGKGMSVLECVFRCPPDYG